MNKIKSIDDVMEYIKDGSLQNYDDQYSKKREAEPAGLVTFETA